jgi:DNA-binding HxlR family transcriptional regulator
MGLMPARKNLDYLDCSVANALDVIGDRWSLLILRDAFLGVRRFDHWQRDLGIARNILAQRLDRLVEAEVLETRRYQDNPPRDEYVLTAKGKDLLDVLLTLWRWGDRWAPPPEEMHRDLIHLDCGEVTHAVPSCAHCGGELKRSNLRIEPGLDVVAQRGSVPA